MEASTAQRRSDRTRRRILDVTLDVISDQGVRAVTQRRVAEAANTSVGLITYHFKSTSSMITAALEQLAESETQRLEAASSAARALERDGRALVDLLVQLITEAATVRRRDVIAASALTLEIPRGSVDRQAFYAWEDAEQSLYSGIALALNIPAPDDFATFLAGIVEGLALYAAISRDPNRIVVAARLGLERLLLLDQD